MSGQAYHHGDFVRVMMGPDPLQGIVVASYAEQYGGDCVDSYTIWVEGQGKISWFRENELLLIESNRQDLMAMWQQKLERDIQQESDLDWIFSNPELALDSGTSLDRLGTDLGIKNMWGPRGEGVTLHANRLILREIAKAYIPNNRDGWLALSKAVNNAR